MTADTEVSVASSVPMDFEREVQSGFAGRYLRRKARQLVGRVGLTRADRPDLEQEMMLLLLIRWPRFDPARGHWHAFVINYEKHSDWLTQTQAAEELKVSHTVIQRLIEERTLPARQVVKCAPWIIERANLALPAVQTAIRAIREGRRSPSTHPAQRELPLK